MIKPITIYGNPVLREECVSIEKTYPGIREVIETMWQTLRNADGCGLAAPQINLPIKLFVVNSRDSYAYMSARERAKITSFSDDVWTTGEGCLIIPDLYEEVTRPWSITIKYQDKEFNEQVKVYHGYTARIIQHEFEHTEGKLYIDHLSPFRKQLLRNKLARILKRKINASYPTQKSY